MSKSTFASVHEYGAREFGLAWLIANRQVVDICKAFDIDYEKHKHGLSFIALRILQHTRPKATEDE